MKTMTTSEILQKFNAALTINQTPELIKFHQEIAQSNLPPDKKIFWLCLCDDEEDIKETFYDYVEHYILNGGGKLNRHDWNKYYYEVSRLN